MAQRQKRAKAKDATTAEEDGENEEDLIGSDDFMSKRFILQRLKREEEDNVNADAMEATKAMQGDGEYFSVFCATKINFFYSQYTCRQSVTGGSVNNIDPL